MKVNVHGNVIVDWGGRGHSLLKTYIREVINDTVNVRWKDLAQILYRCAVSPSDQAKGYYTSSLLLA